MAAAELGLLLKVKITHFKNPQGQLVTKSVVMTGIFIKLVNCV
jgi:hypothetical protein